MNELLQRAERTLAVGLLDEAEGLYRRALEEDQGSAIATLGLARIAGERGNEQEAYLLAARAVELDPDNAAATALTVRLHEILRSRGENVELPRALRRPPGGIDDGRTSGTARSRRGLLDRFLRRGEG